MCKRDFEEANKADSGKVTRYHHGEADKFDSGKSNRDNSGEHPKTGSKGPGDEIFRKNDEEIYKDLFVVTGRFLVKGDFLEQIRKVAQLHPGGLILREKDLPDPDYLELAEKVRDICEKEQVPFFVHGRLEVARQTGCRNIHLPHAMLEGLDRESLAENFDQVSVSCHSMEDVREAEAAGATQIVLGTIFETECKKGLKGKGTAFVRAICQSCHLPVYAIGGITLENLPLVKEAGAAGGCMRSGFMKL